MTKQKPEKHNFPLSVTLPKGFGSVIGTRSSFLISRGSLKFQNTIYHYKENTFLENIEALNDLSYIL